MIFSMALGIVGLTFSTIILCLYFWKKRANVEETLTTLFFKFLVVFLVILGFYEIVCIISMAHADTHPVLNEILCRIHILLDIIWAAVFMVYIYSVTRSKSDDLLEYIKGRRILTLVVVFAVIITYVASCLLKVTYHSAVNPNFMVIGGPALYPVYVIAGIGCIAITIIMLKFKNTLVKNLRFPVIYFMTLFTFLVAIEFIWFEYRVNYIYFVFCFLHMGMFFTIESQDKRLLTQVEKGRKEAEIANKAKTEFLSNISHEIRTPMNTILGFSQALLEEQKLTEDIVKRDAVNIKEASSSLLELINNILDISRIESGKEMVDSKDYKLENLLMEVNSIVSSKVSKDVLELKGISKTIDGEVVLKNMNLTINTNDKVGFVGTNELAITTLFKIITGELEPDSGEVKWGTTVKYDYFPKNHDKFFDNNYDLIDWLRQYSKEQEEPFIRGFLGRMLFSGDEALKKVKVLSGGEKVRCMMSKLMLSGANVLVMDDPTNHLDIESITSLNKGMENFKGALLFSSHDHELLSTVANRIIEFKEDGKYVDKMMNYDEYLESVK